MLREIQRENIEDLIAKGLDVPEPITDENYSGRLNLRMSKSLHRRLAEVAAQEEVSLNTLIINSLHHRTGGGDPPVEVADGDRTHSPRHEQRASPIEDRKSVV